ncbi:unnamed protein product [Lota lota]
MSAVTFDTPRNNPGIAIDTRLPLPVCHSRQPVIQLRSSLLKKFDSAAQVKDPVVGKDPALLGCIPAGIIEAVLTTYKSLKQAFPAGTPFPCVPIPREEEDEMENMLFSRHLPGTLADKLCQHYGEWLHSIKLFNRAFTAVSVQDRRGEEDNRETNGVFSLAENPLTLDCSVAAFKRVCPEDLSVEDTDGGSMDQHGSRDVSGDKSL